MGVLVYAESENNIIKKSALEAVSYGKALAEKIGSSLNCVVINCSEPNILKQYGTDKIFNITNDSLKDFTSKSYSNALQQVIKAENTSILILSSSADSKYLGAHLAGFTDGSFISNVVGIR